MLGRSRQGDKLSEDERKALEHVDVPKPSEGSQAPAAAPVVKVTRDRLTWNWTVPVPWLWVQVQGEWRPRNPASAWPGAAIAGGGWSSPDPVSRQPGRRAVRPWPSGSRFRRDFRSPDWPRPTTGVGRPSPPSSTAVHTARWKTSPTYHRCRWNPGAWPRVWGT